MILDRLDYAHTYHALAPILREALDYLRANDFSQRASGRYAIDGDRLIAIVERYRPKPAAEARFEAHRRYVDVQAMLIGCERMGHTTASERWTATTPYDASRDIGFFDAQGQWIEVSAGNFVIFFPQDLHAPGVAPLAGDGAESPSGEVLKVVMKCAWPA